MSGDMKPFIASANIILLQWEVSQAAVIETLSLYDSFPWGAHAIHSSLAILKPGAQEAIPNRSHVITAIRKASASEISADSGQPSGGGTALLP